MNPIIHKNDRIELDVRLGTMRDECGRPWQRVRPTGGTVLHVDPQRGEAWVLLDNESGPRRVPLDKLRSDKDAKRSKYLEKPCRRRR